MNEPLSAHHDLLNVEHDELLRILCAHFGVEGSYLLGQTEDGNIGSRMPRLERIAIVIPKAATPGPDAPAQEAGRES